MEEEGGVFFRRHSPRVKKEKLLGGSFGGEGGLVSHQKKNCHHHLFRFRFRFLFLQSLSTPLSN